MKIGMAAAGSGGHIFPAIAVAEALVNMGLRRDDIIFFGGDRMEAETVPEAGYPFVEVDIHGIRRSLSFDNLTLPLKVRRARRDIEGWIERAGVRAMAVFGGYVSGPAGLAAKRRSIPLIIHEANAVPGIANRLLARRADTIFVAFEPALAKLPSARVVGNPLRAAFDTFDRDKLRTEARRRYNIDQDSVVLGIVGGSQGAQALNEIAIEIAQSARRTFVMLHLAGAANIESISAVAGVGDAWRVIAFEPDMVSFYAACDVVLARGGSMTVSELHATATPSIIVPLPAGRGYQRENAADFVESGGAIVIEQEDRSGIVGTTVDLLTDGNRRERMARSGAVAQRANAARIIAERLYEVVDD